MITAILVDDEEKSLKNLELLLAEACPAVRIVDKATNALEAVKCILSADPDLVFLVVHMPGYNGFDVLDSIRGSRAIVVFTTAHKNYAINAMRKGAFDYLLKPVDTDELKECVERVRQKLSRAQDNRYNLIELSVKDGIIFIKPADIIRVEASGSYTVFHLENNIKHMVSKSMKEYEAMLDNTVFFRCHNSHIINLRKVVKFIHSNGYFAEMQNGATIEIARKNKELLLEKLKSLQL
jgi:two-component system, LytTR family, response regulator